MYNGKQRIQNQNYVFAFSISYKSLLSIISTNAYEQATLVAYAMFYLLQQFFTATEQRTSDWKANNSCKTQKKP